MSSFLGRQFYRSILYKVLPIKNISVFNPETEMAQSAGAAEHTDCFSAEG